MEVKIIGAWSIGNHLTFAARTKWWNVTVEDVNSQALERMRTEIYPNRYGNWDNDVKQILAWDDGDKHYDMVFVWTPPDVRLDVATRVLSRNRPKLLQLEKVISDPDVSKLDNFLKVIWKTAHQVKVVVGYDHAVGHSFWKFLDLARQIPYAEINSIWVQFRENWQWILNAHPWLKWPWDSYLGYSLKWGWAASEHSHALHLLLYFISQAWDRIEESSGQMDHVDGDHGSKYDREFMFKGTTEKGIKITCDQDVIAIPTKKEFRINMKNWGFAVWECSFNGKDDRIVFENVPWVSDEIIVLEKTRRDDFLYEMNHIEGIFNWGIDIELSPLRLSLASEVLRIISSSL
jgi:predicted dehydrogenase